MNLAETYMRRCLDLALLGAGHTAPNPMVGSVLVYEGRVIGEGYHQQYGQAHAEVNCIRSVKEADIPFIRESTIYVSLEPCAHFGKTPPCADLIIEKKIPRVVVGCRDPFEAVNGKGIEKLRAAGVAVELGILEKECIDLNRRFFTFHTKQRPYILLKWAQSANGKMAAVNGTEGREKAASEGVSRTLISNDFTNRLVHKWRSEEAGILIGTNTALADDPSLTVRLWTGPDPVRLVIDKDLRLPGSLRIFDRQTITIVFNTVKHEEQDNLIYYRLPSEDHLSQGDPLAQRDLRSRNNHLTPGEQRIRGESLVPLIVEALYQLKILSVIVEGGPSLLQSFINEGFWDEARIITNEELLIPDGLASPELRDSRFIHRERLYADSIFYYAPK
ncbi:bifunctional diaminohydroxyphosphoribosylaminopyrimidine deaminase/5-amino-6-(5-phosphoribosylamino)uracil reductase RibD [Flavitalea flava]